MLLQRIPCCLHPDYNRRPDLLCVQYNILYEEIKNASRTAQDYRRNVDLLLTGFQQQRYFEMAFSHFAQSPDEPFNFIAAAFHTVPVGSDFKSHVLQFMDAVNRMHGSENSERSGLESFIENVAAHIAACILLDMYRKDRLQISTFKRAYICILRKHLKSQD